MAKTQAIQEGFTAGEVTPLVHGRVSSPIHKESVALLRNMVSTVHGPATRRFGTKYVTDVKQQAVLSKHKLIPLPIGSPFYQTVMHVGPSNLNIYDVNGIVKDTSSVDVQFASPWAGKDISKLTWAGLTGLNTRLVLCHPEVAPQLLTYDRTGTIVQDTGILEFTAAADIGGGSVAWGSVSNALVQDGSSASALNLDNNVYTNVLRVLDMTGASPVPAGAIIKGIKVTIVGTSNIHSSGADGPNETLVQLVKAGTQVGNNKSTGAMWFYDTGTIKEYGGPTDLWGTTWTAAEINANNFGVVFQGKGHDSANNRELYVNSIKVTIYYATAYVFTLAPITFTASPFGVGEYPSVAGVYQNRLILASSDINPERVWLSKSLDPFNFTTGANPNDSFAFDMEQPGKVKWIEALDTLVIGALSGVWDVTSWDNGPLGPNNYRGRKRDSNAPTSFYHDLDDNGIVYVSHSDQRVFAIRPKDQTDNRYTVNEPSFIGRHLLDSPLTSVSTMAVPHSLVMFAQNNTIISATHDPKVLDYSGWHKHSFNGTIHDVESIFDSGSFVTFVLATFARGASSAIILMIFDWNYPLDNFKVITQASSTTITGLSHLEGQSVYVWANDKSMGPYTVSSNQITGVAEAVTDAIVGIGFSSKMITNRLSRGDMPQGGLKRWNKPTVRVGMGQRPKIFGQRPANALPGNPSLPYPSTEDLEITHNGWNRFGHVEIEEDTAAPLTVYAIHGQVASENV